MNSTLYIIGGLGHSAQVLRSVRRIKANLKPTLDHRVIFSPNPNYQVKSPLMNGIYNNALPDNKINIEISIFKIIKKHAATS